MKATRPDTGHPATPSFYTIERVGELLSSLNAALSHLAAQHVSVRLVELAAGSGYGAVVTEPGTDEAMVTASRQRV